MKLQRLTLTLFNIIMLSGMIKILRVNALPQNSFKLQENTLNVFGCNNRMSICAFCPSLQRERLFLSQSYRFDRKLVVGRGLHVKIHIRGKSTGDFLSEGYQEYEKRLRPVLNLETLWYKTDEDMLKGIEKVNHSEIVCLDPNGKQLTSEKFSTFLYNKLERGGSRLSFVIGGAEGLPASLREKNSHNLFSLSDLTFTHQWARVILAEQIYRATEIQKGSGYHKA